MVGCCVSVLLFTSFGIDVVLLLAEQYRRSRVHTHTHNEHTHSDGIVLAQQQREHLRQQRRAALAQPYLK